MNVIEKNQIEFRRTLLTGIKQGLSLLYKYQDVGEASILALGCQAALIKTLSALAPTVIKQQTQMPSILAD